MPRLWEDLDALLADDREVRICDVDWDQLNMIEDATEGESISVWFIGTRREAWVARSLRQIPLNLHIREPPQRFVVIICQDGLFSTVEELQQFSDLSMLPEIETTMIVPMNYNDADGPPCDGKEVQICNVDGDKEIDIKYATEGEFVNVWFMGKTRAA